jgi:stage IV sporulation protein B
MFQKQKTSLILLLLIIIPIQVFAYSDYIIPGGETIGIEMTTNGVVVVGTYEIDGKNPAKDAGIKIGDIITAVDGNSISSIDELVETINTSKDSSLITYLRDEEEYETNLQITSEDGVSKTGLYVKDSITGIGTLSYIDPETHIYGALGHEIIESNTGQMLEVKDGKIVDSEVTNIERSSVGSPGSKSAQLEYDQVKGNILENTKSGIFGKFEESLPNKKTYKVAKPEDIKKGEAKILTVIDGQEVGEYTINILKLSKDENKNILFEITDQTLLEKTGGIVQGMSGSPIIQGEYIIGAVTHVVVDDPTKGYGIYITNMLEEGEN